MYETRYSIPRDRLTPPQTHDAKTHHLYTAPHITTIYYEFKSIHYIIIMRTVCFIYIL